MNSERLLDGNGAQVANQFFTETSPPKFPYRFKGNYAEMSLHKHA